MQFLTLLFLTLCSPTYHQTIPSRIAPPKYRYLPSQLPSNLLLTYQPPAYQKKIGKLYSQNYNYHSCPKYHLPQVILQTKYAFAS